MTKHFQVADLSILVHMVEALLAELLVLRKLLEVKVRKHFQVAERLVLEQGVEALLAELLALRKLLFADSQQV